MDKLAKAGFKFLYFVFHTVLTLMEDNGCLEAGKTQSTTCRKCSAALQLLTLRFVFDKKKLNTLFFIKECKVNIF